MNGLFYILRYTISPLSSTPGRCPTAVYQTYRPDGFPQNSVPRRPIGGYHISEFREMYFCLFRKWGNVAKKSEGDFEIIASRAAPIRPDAQVYRIPIFSKKRPFSSPTWMQRPSAAPAHMVPQVNSVREEPRQIPENADPTARACRIANPGSRVVALCAISERCLSMRGRVRVDNFS